MTSMLHAFASAHPLLCRKPAVHNVCQTRSVTVVAVIPRPLPALLAVTAAAAGALAYSRPKLLPQAVRRTTPALIVAALLVAALLRPRGRGRKTEEGGQAEPVAVQSEDASENSRSDSRLPQEAKTIFSNSRLEWEDQSTAAAAMASDAVTNAEASDKAKPVSTVYSYSYARSRKKPRSTRSSTPSAKTASKGGAPGTGNFEKAAAPSTFAHMRTEFQPSGSRSSEDIQFADNDPERGKDWVPVRTGYTANSEESHFEQQASSSRFEEDFGGTKPPRPLSTTSLIKALVRAPVWFLSDIVLPVADVVSLIWYDFKVWVLGWRERRSRKGPDKYFLPEVTGNMMSSIDDNNIEEDELSEEERQVMQVQRMGRRVIGGVQGTVKRLLGEFL